MDLMLKDRTVVITAAGSGIGLACARSFLQEGARVVAGDVNTKALQAIDGGGNLVVIEGDLVDPQGPVALVETALATFGTVDCLVNNLGSGAARESFLTVTDEDWTTMLTRNVFAMIRACRAALPGMVTRKRGAIVNIASTSGRQPDPFLVDYSAAKSTVLSITKSLSVEFGPKGIRANCVSPGPTRTPAYLRSIGTVMAAKWGMTTEEALHFHAADFHRMSLGHAGRPEDVAAVVTFLASDVSAQVTGADYVVDGGLLKTI